MKQIEYCIILLCVVVFPFELIAQEITGKVINAKEESIAFANVVILSDNDSIFVDGTVTDKNGCFILKTEKLDKPNCIIKISFIGYKNNYINSTKNSKIGTVLLEESSRELAELVVTANKPIFKSLNGSIITDVSNSILSKEHSINDLLVKVPGIINNKGNIEVFGSGTPIYYINNKKVQNIEEVNNINVENIKNIELITNPGSRYDATAKAVIKITTIKREDGVSVSLRARGIQSEHFSHNESVTLSYKNKSFNSTAYYSFYDYYGHSNQDVTKEANVDTLWRYVTDRTRTPKAKRHYYRLSLDYEFNPKHNIGLQVNGSYIRQKEKANETNTIDANNESYLSFDGLSKLSTTTNNIQVNLFHNSKWNEKTSSNLNLDYVRYTDPRNQQVEEIYPDYKITTHMNGDSKIDIYAGEYILDYNINRSSTLSAGINFSFIDGYGDLRTQTEYVAESKYVNKEDKVAGFIDYSIRFADISFNAGLRYENVYTKYNDMLNSTNNINRKYQRLFPSFTISHSKNNLSNSITLTSRTERPPLSFLNGQTYYQNQFMYQIGNPKLIPQTSYILEWMLGYKSINFRASYTRTNDYISSIFENHPNNESKIVSTWDNFNKAEFLKANINYQSTFYKFWNTSITIGAIKPFFKSEYLGKTISYNKAAVYISNNNYFRLPSGYLLSLNYYLNTGGSERIFTSDFFNTMDVGIQKLFLKDRLSIALKCNDIFRGLTYEQSAKINNFYFHQREKYSEWNFSIDMIYRFNQQKTKYRGKSSAQEEINRL